MDQTRDDGAGLGMGDDGMDEDDQINWVSVTLSFSAEQGAVLEAAAKREGLSVKCYCLHLLFRHLPDAASPPDEERQQRQFQATLRRNECQA